MSINLANLAPQGRAKSPTQPWSPEEWEAVCTLVSERNIARTTAADYVRNGIATLEAYDKAVEKDFVPLSQDEAARKAEEDLKARGADFSESVASEASRKPTKKTKSKKSND